MKAKELLYILKNMPGDAEIEIEIGDSRYTTEKMKVKKHFYNVKSNKWVTLNLNITQEELDFSSKSSYFEKRIKTRRLINDLKADLEKY